MLELVTDFVRNGGTYMVLTAKEGLDSSHINQVQRTMLSSVTVPNLLQLDVREVDFAVSLQYEITGKRMLSQCLKQEKIGMAELYSLLLQVVTALDDSKRYLLSPDKYIMNVDHIFVEDVLAFGILHFVYVPVLDPLAEEPLTKMLLSLITGMMTSVTVIEGGGIQRLLRFCSDEMFSLAEMKRMLLDLLVDDQPASSATSGTGAQVTKMPKFQSPSHSPVIVKEYLPMQMAEPGIADTPRSFAFGYDQPVKAPETAGGGNEEETIQRSSKRTYILLGVLLVIAVIWKFAYLDHPAMITLIISFAMTVILAIIALLLLRGKLHFPGDSKQAEIPSYFEAFGGKRGESHTNDWGWQEESMKSIPEDFADNRERRSSALPKLESRSLKAEQAVNTALAPQTQTVLLGRHAAPGTGHSMLAAATFVLERITSDRTPPEFIPLKAGSFVIGRSGEMAQYVDGTAGVSRAHVEVMVRSGECSLKDLGSRNGTRLCGEMMSPYKEYALNPDDDFMIAEGTYILRKSS
ncbi:FHA domain-containing protein [Fontibacillus phaseoli]|uniref:FHA domain-containing protein n=1 Tax=Fontibacillus phaseoli TaxID=1416533 RepID=A0A369BL49_9BACL|nr:DUF6382 domain-containing protein [Fontibacillus phaseoli]RCX20424.1 FHA domain-containing protein [Fontibacillus phaseoli]